MTDEIDERAKLAETMARDAARLAMSFFNDRARLDIRSKGKRDLVTAADQAVERLIRERVTAAFPQDRVLGEDEGGEIADRLWVVDPIDGTANFARGLPSFAVSIAFCREQHPLIGVIAEPAAAAIYTAKKGGGAFRNGVAIRASTATELDQSFVEFGYAERRTAEENLRLMRRMIDSGCDVRLIGSATLGLARVAEGLSEGYCELYLNSWDVMAGLVLIEEAGGRVCDFLANDGLRCGNPTIVSAPGIAEALAHVTGLAFS